MNLIEKLRVIETRDVTKLMYESASVELHLFDGYATVSSLYSQERRKGHASALMTLVTLFADEHKLNLILEVGRYGHPIGPDNDQLMKFYQDFGFVREGTGRPIFMTRNSQELHGLL